MIPETPPFLEFANLKKSFLGSAKLATPTRINSFIPQPLTSEPDLDTNAESMQHSLQIKCIQSLNTAISSIPTNSPLSIYIYRDAHIVLWTAQTIIASYRRSFMFPAKARSTDTLVASFVNIRRPVTTLTVTAGCRVACTTVNSSIHVSS